MTVAILYAMLSYLKYYFFKDNENDYLVPIVVILVSMFDVDVLNVWLLVHYYNELVHILNYNEWIPITFVNDTEYNKSYYLEEFFHSRTWK